MKSLSKFLTMLALLLTVATGAWAQQPELKPIPLQRGEVNLPAATALPRALKADKANSPATNGRKAPRRAMGLVTPPADATAETYYTTSGTFYLYGSSGWEDHTSQMSSIKVIVSDNDIYISGLAYYVDGDSWIKGTINGNKATFPTSQQVDDSAYYPEWLNGSNDLSDVTDIVFTFEQGAGTLTAETPYICESGAESFLQTYGYWSQPTFSKTAPELSTTVTLTLAANNSEWGTVEPVMSGGPVTYTELKGGEVLHVGDVLKPTGDVYWIFGEGISSEYLYSEDAPFTLIRANISGLWGSTVTPAEDGEYYVLQYVDSFTNKESYITLHKDMTVTDASDGISVTFGASGYDEDEDCTVYQYTFAVHEGSGSGTNSADIVDNGDGTYSVVSGSNVTVKATPAEGYHLASWSNGAEVNDEGTTTLTVTEAITLTATFASNSFNLTVGESEHGTVTFTVDGTAATQAAKDDVVTVSVTPDDGYAAKDVTVRAYTSWEAASARRRAPGLLDEITVTKNETDGTWTFTMPEANVWVVATYTKNLQDAWIQTIADQTYTGEAIEPTVTVKDGETTLVLDTDYTVAYSNNTNAGTATVTVTAADGSDYSGEATATFTIAKADITMTTAPAAVADLVYSGEAQTLVTAGVASFGTVLYSTDGTTYAEALPTATDAGTYTVYYKVEGDANHNAFSAQTVSVTITTNKTALNTAITEAETYYNSISETNPDAAATLLEAINAAKTVQGNADATQTEIETATTTLNDAVAAAKADVALKRITLVIPAKSYVARVDADKRTIETAVEGVSLYSVKSVTDSEVELTAALSVVAAEMPYLIYNDTDEEQTISIVVSTDDADAVEYDSEHFKGTLTDKTFTDEDMQAADHYVLQNGQDFVWVKDAGTLAAGKCWIELIPASEAHARRLSIVHEGGTTTGINAVSSVVNAGDNWYSLDGRRLAGKPTMRGVYIHNGRKTVVR